MTDTTDVAALKKQIDTAADIIRDLTDRLEAERQRAERGEAAAGIIQQAYATLERSLRHTEETLVASNDLLSAAEAENAALKTKLALKSEKLADCESALDKALHREKVVERKLLTAQEDNASLYAKLANPVVLTDCDIGAVSHMAHWYTEDQCEAWVAGVEHSKKQIVAAGFPVKGQ